jgi:hypothetical protein
MKEKKERKFRFTSFLAWRVEGRTSLWNEGEGIFRQSQKKGPKTLKHSMDDPLIKRWKLWVAVTCSFDGRPFAFFNFLSFLKKNSLLFVSVRSLEHSGIACFVYRIIMLRKVLCI